MKIEQNISRLKYLLKLYNISIDELLNIISEGLKKPISRDEIFSKEIKIGILKRIDSFFNKGLHYYLDPKSPEISKEASIFFRKESFNSDLNIGAKIIVNHFEEFKVSLSAIAKLADLNLSRVVPYYKLSDDPKFAANNIRNRLYPEFSGDRKEFLKFLIFKFSENNILVFEFVETWNKKNKANIDGFFITPNVIVLKRQQEFLRREIFTLAHELGHFLLNEEEIDRLDYDSIAQHNLSFIERWCNDFSFYFLAGQYIDEVDKIELASSKNDYHHELIDEISRKTHLSNIALFTRLLFKNKISQSDYNKIRKDEEEKYRKKLKEEQRQKEINKELGIKQTGRTPQPIKSPLLISTLQTAFYEGVLTEYEVCKHLNIKPDKIGEYIQ